MLGMFKKQESEQPLGLFKQETATDYLSQIVRRLMQQKQIQPNMQISALLTTLNGWISEQQALNILTTLAENRDEILDLIEDIADDAEKWLQENQR